MGGRFFVIREDIIAAKGSIMDTSVGTRSDTSEKTTLRATVHVGERLWLTTTREKVADRSRILGEPLLLRGTELPAEATYSIKNTSEERLPRLLYLYFGEDKPTRMNVSLGHFSVQGIPHTPRGPSQIKIKIIVKNRVAVHFAPGRDIAMADRHIMEAKRVGSQHIRNIFPTIVHYHSRLRISGPT